MLVRLFKYTMLCSFFLLGACSFLNEEGSGVEVDVTHAQEPSYYVNMDGDDVISMTQQASDRDVRVFSFEDNQSIPSHSIQNHDEIFSLNNPDVKIFPAGQPNINIDDSKVSPQITLNAPFDTKNVDTQTNMSSIKIYFNHDSTILDENDMNIIRTIVRSYKNNSNQVYRIDGHASSESSVSDLALRRKINHNISLKRARSVAKALEAHGVLRDNIHVHAWGEERPAAANEYLDQESASRRVEISRVKGQE